MRLHTPTRRTAAPRAPSGNGPRSQFLEPRTASSVLTTLPIHFSLACLVSILSPPRPPLLSCRLPLSLLIPYYTIDSRTSLDTFDTQASESAIPYAALTYEGKRDSHYTLYTQPYPFPLMDDVSHSPYIFTYIPWSL